ncbi:helix-turn-helix domain-containing protein [Streptomyces sp. NPDC059740]|uniref:helix-turn-helix domain-containing protein n=1 Tax=Streptomyces sp. NPDC059740 TaxID=3346926 RepID=UPI0036606B52
MTPPQPSGESADPAASWLALLLADADGDALEEFRRREAGRAGDEAERAAVAAEALRAERLRSLLRERRQRAGELAALNDLALRLSGTRELGALLQDTVEQARRLLDVDVAYLALVGPDGAMTIEVTDGSTGPQLRGVVLLPDSGLAGRVMARGEPVQSPDYLADVGLAHVADVDEVARAEGLRTILGAPLRLRGEAIGVLMVAQRAVRTFTGGETSLLSSLASFAAVAIANARLIEEQRRAATGLADLNDRLRRHVDHMDRAIALHDRLLRAALRGGGVGEVVAGLSGVLEAPVTFLDARDRPVVSARDGRALDGGEALRGEEVAGRPPSQVFRRPGDRVTRFDADLVTVPVASADSYFGALQVRLGQDGPEPPEGRVRLLERGALTLALVASAGRAVADAERRNASEVLEQLATRRVTDTAAFARRARPAGLDVTAPHTVAVLDPPEEAAGRVRERLAELAEAHGGLVGQVLGRTVAVLAAPPDTVRACVLPTGVTAGLDGPATGAAALADAYDSARACLDVLRALDRDGGCASPAELGPYRLLLSTAGRADARRYVAAAVGPLLAHDTERGTELAPTADAFLSGGRRHAATANALRIHPNTLYQRLDRIAGLLGADWREGDRALEVQLALRLHRLAHEVAEGGPGEGPGKSSEAGAGAGRPDGTGPGG